MRQSRTSESTPSGAPHETNGPVSEEVRLEVDVLADQSGAGVRGASPARQPESAKVRLLVVDDDPELRAYARGCIESLHGDIAEVIEAGDGLQALARARAERVDLIICDVVMPRMGGLELIDELRQDPRLERIPVLVVTGELAGRDARARTESLRGVAVLPKPFNAGGLCGAVEEMLRNRGPPG